MTKPDLLLIDEKVVSRLQGEDRRDYIEAVKEYNRSGDKFFWKAAMYFENGKENTNGVDLELLKKVQLIIKDIPLRRIDLCKVAGLSITLVADIETGYCMNLGNERLKLALDRLQSLNVKVLQ